MPSMMLSLWPSLAVGVVLLLLVVTVAVVMISFLLFVVVVTMVMTIRPTYIGYVFRIFISACAGVVRGSHVVTA